MSRKVELDMNWEYTPSEGEQAFADNSEEKTEDFLEEIASDITEELSSLLFKGTTMKVRAAYGDKEVIRVVKGGEEAL